MIVICNPYRFSKYSAEYQAVLDYASSQAYTLPSAAQSLENDTIIRNLKSIGAWDYDLFYYFKQEAGLSDFCRINWANPSSNYLSPNGTINFVAGSGFKSLSSQQFSFNTGHVPADDATSYDEITLTCFYKVFDIPSTPAFTAFFSGCRVANNTQQWGNFWLSSGTSYNWRAFNSASVVETIAQADLNAHYMIAKDGVDGSGHMGFYIDGVFEASDGSGSGGLTPTYEMYIMGNNNAGTLVTNAQDLGMSYFALGNFFGTSGTPPNDALELEIYQIMNQTY